MNFHTIFIFSLLVFSVSTKSRSKRTLPFILRQVADALGYDLTFQANLSPRPPPAQPVPPLRPAPPTAPAAPPATAPPPPPPPPPTAPPAPPPPPPPPPAAPRADPDPPALPPPPPPPVPPATLTTTNFTLNLNWNRNQGAMTAPSAPSAPGAVLNTRFVPSSPIPLPDITSPLSYNSVIRPQIQVRILPATAPAQQQQQPPTAPEPRRQQRPRPTAPEQPSGPTGFEQQQDNAPTAPEEQQQFDPTAPEQQQFDPTAPEQQQFDPTAPELQQLDPTAPELQQLDPTAPELQQLDPTPPLRQQQIDPSEPEPPLRPEFVAREQANDFNSQENYDDQYQNEPAESKDQDVGYQKRVDDFWAKSPWKPTFNIYYSDPFTTHAVKTVHAPAPRRREPQYLDDGVYLNNYNRNNIAQASYHRPKSYTYTNRYGF